MELISLFALCWENWIIIYLIAGFLTDQEEYQEHLEMSRRYENYSSEKYKDDRFHLSNISFSGPVVLGIGGEVLSSFIKKNIKDSFHFPQDSWW